MDLTSLKFLKLKPDVANQLRRDATYYLIRLGYQKPASLSHAYTDVTYAKYELNPNTIQGTRGVLITPKGAYVCSMEPSMEWNGPANKVSGKTSIPVGTYKLDWTYSAAISKWRGKPSSAPLLVNVPGFEGVRIHEGSKLSNTHGCILPGYVPTPEGFKPGTTTPANDYISSEIAADVTAAKAGKAAWPKICIMDVADSSSFLKGDPDLVLNQLLTK